MNSDFYVVYCHSSPSRSVSTHFWPKPLHVGYVLCVQRKRHNENVATAYSLYIKANHMCNCGRNENVFAYGFVCVYIICLLCVWKESQG